MSPNETIWLLFLPPVGIFAAAQFVIWLTRREDRAAERKRNRLPPRETGTPV